MSQSDDEALQTIRALLGVSPPEESGTEAASHQDDTDPDLGSFTRRLFNTPTPTKEDK